MADKPEPAWKNPEWQSNPEFPGLRIRPAMEWNPLPLMEDYLEELELEGKSKSHVKNVRNALLHLSRFLRKTTDILHPAEVTRIHLLRFHAYLIGEQYSEGYIGNMMNKVGRWFDWLVMGGHIDNTPYHHIKVKNPGKKPNPIETEDLDLLFATHRQQAFSIPPFVYHRREMMLAVLYGWGLRVSEAVSLNVTQMDMRQDFVSVQSVKGGPVKHLPYGDSLKFATQRWLRLRAKHAKIGEDALLIATHGGRWTTHGISQCLHELGARAGVRINPHRLRDTLGTRLLDGDMPVERVMKILGHRTMASTLSYARVNDEPVKRDYEKTMEAELHGLLFRRTRPQRPSEPGVNEAR